MNATKTPNAELMTSHGYELYHTGGGCMAWMREVEGGYILITNDDAGVDSDADEVVWIVGRYLDGGEQGGVVGDLQYGFVITGDYATLHDALARADTLPIPQDGDERLI